MATEVNGALVLNEVSTDGGVTWKTIVCEDQSQISGTNTANETRTKTCGVFTGVITNSVKITGSGVAGGDLASNQLSYQQLQILRDGLTKIKFRRQNAAVGTIGQGEITKCVCDGYMTEVTETSNDGDVTKFNWAFTSTGIPDFTHTS